MRLFGSGSGASHLAMEFFVIVAGVLAALAVDQWRESREELGLERELLQSLSLDLLSDSMDFAVLPDRALGRATAAEILLRAFRPGAARSVRSLAAIDTLGPFPQAVSDSALVQAFNALVSSSDLDVAGGAYREFADGGGQRLVRNRDLRRRVHEYQYEVAANLKYNPVVAAAIVEVRRRAHDLGVAPGDTDARLIQERLSSPDADPFFASVRSLQSISVSQNRIGWILLNDAKTLLGAIRTELGAGG